MACVFVRSKILPTPTGKQWIFQCDNAMFKMDKRKVFILIFFCFLISKAVCKGKENHVSKETHSEVNAGSFKNPSAKNADAPLRSKQHCFFVRSSTNSDSLTSDDERNESMDGKIVPKLQNGLKTTKMNPEDKDDTMNKALIKRKIAAMKRSAKMTHKLKVLATTQGAKVSSSAARLKEKKSEDAFAFQNNPTSTTGPGECYKTKVHTPLKLTTLPTEELSVNPSVYTTDGESKQNDDAEGDEQNSSHSNDNDKDDSLPNGEPKVTGHEEGSNQHGGTSATPQHKMAVYPVRMKTSSGLRWNVAHDYVKLDDSKSGKHSKKKKQKTEFRTEDPVDSDSSASTVAGILAGILMLLIVYTGAPRLWELCKQRWQRRYYRVFGLNIPSTGYYSDGLSDEEVIFDRTAMARNKTSSEFTGPNSDLNTSTRKPYSAPASHHSTEQGQKIWTLTDTPKSTSLMAAATLADTPSTEVWTVNEISESKSQESLLTTSSLSDVSTGEPRTKSLTSVSSVSLTLQLDICDSVLAHSTRPPTPPCDDTEKSVPSPLPMTTESRLGAFTSSEPTIPDSSFSPHRPASKESASSSSLLPAASDELTGSVSMATTSTSPSTESCKTPVAPRNDVVITIGDDDFDKETSRKEVVIKMDCDDEQGQYEASSAALTPPAIPLTTASTEMRKGKSLIGGRKALENRRFIKQMVSEQKTTGLKHDLNTAISRILGENRPLEDNNKGKRNVIKHQTQETKHSLAESILRAKSMILNENVDKKRDRRSFRQAIQKTLSYPVRPALRPQRTLAKEIAFAKDIILPGRAHPRAAAQKTKVKRQVLRGDESINPTSKDASTVNYETRTKYMNHRDYQNWKLLLRETAEMKRAKGIKPDVFLPSLKQVASFFDIAISDVSSDVTVCQCYYCDKFRKKERAKRLFNMSRFQRVGLALDVYTS